MKHTLTLSSAVLFIVSLTGCAELKQLRIETAEQKIAIEQLEDDYQTCRATLEKTRENLRQTQTELDIMEIDLRTKEVELKKKDLAAKDQSEAFTRMQEVMKAELNSKQVAINELQGRLTLTMVESILFDSGSANVKYEGISALKRIAGVLSNIHDQEIIVAGHTDNVQIKGVLTRTYPSNWELSAARAISVVKILITEGVDPWNLAASGYGEYRPVANNDTPEGRAQNRRMEIILMPKLVK